MLQKWNSNIQFNYIVACSKFSAKIRLDLIFKLRAVVPCGFNFSSHLIVPVPKRYIKACGKLRHLWGWRGLNLQSWGRIVFLLISINAQKDSLYLSQEPQGFVWEQIGFFVASAPDLRNSHERSKSQSTNLVPKGHLQEGPWKPDESLMGLIGSWFCKIQRNLS